MTVSVITGKDLLAHADEIEISEEMRKRIDPDGFNVVKFQFPYRSGRYIRALMHFKFLGNKHPEEGAIAIPVDLYETIVQTSDISSDAVH